MAKKTKEEESVLVTAAKTIGATAGKIAALVGGSEGSPKAAKPSGRFEKTGKKRLPRRAKKAQKKAALLGA